MPRRALSLEGNTALVTAAFIARRPIGRIGRAREIADLVEHPAGAACTTGQIHVIDGGWSI